MFGFLKKSLKGVISKFSDKIEKEGEEKVEEKLIEETKEDKPVEKIEEKKVIEEIKKEEPKKETPIENKTIEEPKEDISIKEEKEQTVEEIIETPKEEKKSFFSKLKDKFSGKSEKERKIEDIKEALDIKEEDIPKDQVKITYFVHGTTTDNEEHKGTGYNDGELSELGIKQSKELGHIVDSKKFDIVISSDLRRAVDSAELGFKDKYKIIQDKRIRECNYGDWNGKVKDWKIIDYIDKKYPNGESYKDVEIRIKEFLNYLYRKYKGKHVAIVAHQAPQLAIEVLLLKKTWEQIINEDWRKQKAWKPGWEYFIKEKLEEPIPKIPSADEILKEFDKKETTEKSKEEEITLKEEKVEETKEIPEEALEVTEELKEDIEDSIKKSTGMHIKEKPVETKIIEKEVEKAEEIQKAKEKIKEIEENIEEKKTDKAVDNFKKAQTNIENAGKIEQDLKKPTASDILAEVAEEQEDLKKDVEKVQEEIKEVKEDIKEKDIEQAKKDIKKLHEDTKKLIKKHPEIKEIQIEEKEAIEEEATGFFGRLKQKIVTKKITSDQFDDMFWDMELALLENNVAVEVIEKIKFELKEALVDKPIKRSQISNTIISTLKKSITELFDVGEIDILEEIKKKQPYVICFIGINGSGKTTTIAKFAKLLQDNNHSVVMAASDTFRAAAIDQLEEHANNLNVKLIKHDYNSDPAAVAFDAIKYAKAKNIDVVLIDTAGRLHSNVNLMAELKKVIRVSNPDLKIFVGEAITGNDCVEQAQQFNETVGVDGIILAKADIDEKGGASISVSHVTKKPILYLGTGQNYEDLEKFDKNIIMNNLGL